jgi:WS/DGAT/MGAT family acyltransferase
MQQLSGADASFLYFETPKEPGHIFSLYIYDQSSAPNGKVTFKGILDHVERRLHVARAFRQRLVRVPFDLDHPYWVNDPDFDLEYHVRHIALPQPGDWRQLCIQVARLHSRHLDHSRPLWEMYVIEGLNNVEGLPRGSFAIMQKTHHAAIDGVSALELTGAVHDRSPDAEATEPPDDWTPERIPTDFELLARAGVNNAQRPMRLARMMARSMPGGGRMQEQFMQRRLELPPTPPAPVTRFSNTVSGHRVFEGRRYDLGRIRKIKAAVPGATVNDAVIAIVGGGLRRYLSEKGELPPESMRVMAPISTRTPGEASTGGNQVSAMVATLGTDVEDPRERLSVVRDSTHQSKAFAEAIDARALSEMSELVPAGLTALGARTAAQFEMATQTTPVVNTVVSNVPGPTEPLYVAGARLVTLFGGAAVVSGMGLLHGVLSYCGELTISVNSDRAVMPDPAEYGRCLDESYAEMAEATVGTKTKGAKAKAKT